jgi:hypothetical protein
VQKWQSIISKSVGIGKEKKYNLKSNYLGTSFVKNDFDIENSTKFLEKKKMEGNEII